MLHVPDKTAARNDVRYVHLVPSHLTRHETQSSGRNRPRISVRTVRQHLKVVGLRCRRPYLEAILTLNHMRLDPSTGR